MYTLTAIINKTYNSHSYVGVTIGPSYKYSSEPYDDSKEMRNVRTNA